MNHSSSYNDQLRSRITQVRVNNNDKEPYMTVSCTIDGLRYKNRAVSQLDAIFYDREEDAVEVAARTYADVLAAEPFMGQPYSNAIMLAGRLADDLKRYLNAEIHDDYEMFYPTATQLYEKIRQLSDRIPAHCRPDWLSKAQLEKLGQSVMDDRAELDAILASPNGKRMANVMAYSVYSEEQKCSVKKFFADIDGIHRYGSSPVTKGIVCKTWKEYEQMTEGKTLCQRKAVDYRLAEQFFQRLLDKPPLQLSEKDNIPRSLLHKTDYMYEIDCRLTFGQLTEILKKEGVHIPVAVDNRELEIGIDEEGFIRQEDLLKVINTGKGYGVVYDVSDKWYFINNEMDDEEELDSIKLMSDVIKKQQLIESRKSQAHHNAATRKISDVAVIRMAGGGHRIRCKIDGVQQLAKTLTPMHAQLISKGELKKEAAAAQYFRSELAAENQQVRSKGLKR